MISSWYAMVNLVKAMAGVGAFAVPAAFQQAGLWMGIILAILLGFVNAQSFVKLVRCSQYLSKKKQLEHTDTNKVATMSIPMTNSSENTRHNTSDTSKNGSERRTFQKQVEETKVTEAEEKRVALNYGDMAEEAFATRKSKYLKKLAKPMKIAVNICVIGLQLGICSAFYIFVVDHAKEVLDHLLSKDLSRDMLFFAILPFFILVATVRSLVLLSWIGFIGNILVIAAILIIIVQMVLMKHIPLSQLPAFTTIEGATLAAGSIIYAYSAQGVVLPVENKMKRPQDMLGFFGVISLSCALISVLYCTSGFLGFITYGDSLKGSITLNLTNSPLDFSVKVMLLLMTYCGYLIQHYPVVDMLMKPIEHRFESSPRYVILLVEYIIRYAVVFLTFGLAYAIPNFKEIIPFVGVTTGMMLALVFPPLLETVVFFNQWRRGNTFMLVFNVTINIFYIILGILFVIVGIISNVRILSDSDRSS
ncbi:hypothetical protein RB195_017151 [Necator americanus]|uniref:Amino acid transporter transmembrane domain-containing protein n=3 Tax=Necator americanus TaxID=51031 RepID=A0ABR1C6D5_NECAM